MQPSSSFSCTPQPPGLEHQLRLPQNVGCGGFREEMLFRMSPQRMRRELLQAQGCSAGTCLLPWGALGLQTHRVPQRGPQECCGTMLEQAAALPEIKSSTNPQLLLCPGGCRPGLGHTGSTVGHTGLSPSRGPCGAGAPWRHRCHLPPRRDPAGHKATHCCDSSHALSDRDA